jgi:hypothetical protein
LLSGVGSDLIVLMGDDDEVGAAELPDTPFVENETGPVVTA